VEQNRHRGAAAVDADPHFTFPGGDLILRLAHVQLVTDQMTGGDGGLVRLVDDAVRLERGDERVVGGVCMGGRSRSERAEQRARRKRAGGQ
jgi:hypothetical protein